jgi:hypothetical protein
VLVGNLTDGADDALEFSIEDTTAEESGGFAVTCSDETLTLYPDGSYEFAIDPSQNGLD